MQNLLRIGYEKILLLAPLVFRGDYLFSAVENVTSLLYTATLNMFVFIWMPWIRGIQQIIEKQTAQGKKAAFTQGK